jgi:hypothetical protein
MGNDGIVGEKWEEGESGVKLARMRLRGMDGRMIGDCLIQWGCAGISPKMDGK